MHNLANLAQFEGRKVSPKNARKQLASNILAVSPVIFFSNFLMVLTRSFRSTSAL
jgi:hypothetical protein